MKLKSEKGLALRNSKGFTLVEILVAISILTVIAALGLLISMDFFGDYSFRSEKNTIVTLLQNARGQSLNNIDEVRHGIHFQGSPVKYIEFECPSVTPQCSSYTPSSSDLTMTPSYDIYFVSPSLPFDVVFDQLSGDCVSCSSPIAIVIKENNNQYTININSEGRIDW